MYETIRRLYRLGLYTKEQATIFVKSGSITKAQYDEITQEEKENRKQKGAV